MDDPTLMEAPEEPGALEQLARDPSSRKRFLKMMGGAGAASSFAVFLAACGGGGGGGGGGSQQSQPPKAQKSPPPSSMFGKGDIGILNYALTLEYLETDFYQKAAQSGMLKGKVLQVAKAFGQEEAQHVAAIKKTVQKLGGKPAKKPKAKFPLQSQQQILMTAASVENLGAAAYLGQATNIQSKEVLAAALSIHSVEGRHAAALNAVIGQNPTPDGAFAKPKTMQEVLMTVKPFLVS